MRLNGGLAPAWHVVTKGYCSWFYYPFFPWPQGSGRGNPVCVPDYRVGLEPQLRVSGHWSFGLSRYNQQRVSVEPRGQETLPWPGLIFAPLRGGGSPWLAWHPGSSEDRSPLACFFWEPASQDVALQPRHLPRCGWPPSRDRLPRGFLGPARRPTRSAHPAGGPQRGARPPPRAHSTPLTHQTWKVFVRHPEVACVLESLARGGDL